VLCSSTLHLTKKPPVGSFSVLAEAVVASHKCSAT
jgi:hypothetical protein